MWFVNNILAGGGYWGGGPATWGVAATGADWLLAGANRFTGHTLGVSTIPFVGGFFGNIGFGGFDMSGLSAGWPWGSTVGYNYGMDWFFQPSYSPWIDPRSNPWNNPWNHHPGGIPATPPVQGRYPQPGYNYPPPPPSSGRYDFSQLSWKNHGGDSAVFERALKFVEKQEGGFANDPDDRGGPTMAGVTQGAYDSWRRKKGRPTRSVAQSTPQERQQLYYEDYYLASGAHEMPEPWALVMFDTAVNMGVGGAKELYRQSGGNMERFFELREQKYRRLAQAPGQGKFLRGWLNRLSDLEQIVKTG